jgi:hypothetical protein
VETDLTDANLSDCHIYGISAWNLKLERAEQHNLVITPYNVMPSGLIVDETIIAAFEKASLGEKTRIAWRAAAITEPEITVDNIEVAQFIYLMLNNQKVREVINTITSKAVLILGRFTDERKAVLDALRDELRKRNYLPILFDFKVPERRNTTETVTLLARMARFIIADLTDPRSSHRSCKRSFLPFAYLFNQCCWKVRRLIQCSRTSRITLGCFPNTGTSSLSTYSQRSRRRSSHQRKGRRRPWPSDGA